MRTYLLITGGWLIAAAITAITYARLAAYGARSDAHLGEPKPRRRRTSWTFPLQVATPLALACAAAVFVGDFGLEPQSVRKLPAVQLAEAPPVRMADPAPAPATAPKAQRRPERAGRKRSATRTRPAAARARSAGARERAASPVSAGGGVRFVSRPVAPSKPIASPQRPTRPQRGGQPQRPQRPQRPGGSSSPKPTPTPTPSPAPTTPAVAVVAAQPTPAPAPSSSRPASVPAAAGGYGKKAKKPKLHGNGPPAHAPAHGYRAKQKG